MCRRVLCGFLAVICGGSSFACLAATGHGSPSVVTLVAQGGPTPFEIPSLVAYGPLGVLFGVFVYFIVWYGPGVVDSYTRALDAATDHLPRVASSLEKIAEAAGRRPPPHDWSD